MSTVVRITAESTDEEGWKLVLDAALDESKFIKRQICFGTAVYQEDQSVTRWPVILRPSYENSGTWVLDYGTEHPDEPQVTNLVEKKIEVDNYFTIYDGSEEITFSIARVVEL